MNKRWNPRTSSNSLSDPSQPLNPALRSSSKGAGRQANQTLIDLEGSSRLYDSYDNQAWFVCWFVHPCVRRCRIRMKLRGWPFSHHSSNLFWDTRKMDFSLLTLHFPERFLIPRPLIRYSRTCGCDEEITDRRDVQAARSCDWTTVRLRPVSCNLVCCVSWRLS